MFNDVILAISRFLEALDSLEINYYVGGSVASIIYGNARTTRDVDFVLTIQAESGALLADHLERDFFVDLHSIVRAILDGDCFNVLDRETVFQVDVFTPKPSAWVATQFSRRRLQRFGLGSQQLEFWTCSPEDVILNKLIWFRIGNEVSRLQWEDALGVLQVQQGKLDLAYLEDWSARLEVADLLRRLNESK